MKTTVTIHIEFDLNDDEECGDHRKVESQFSGDWESVGNAIGEALAMANVPRPVQTVAQIVESLNIDEGQLPSGRLAAAAYDIRDGFDAVDALRKSNAPIEDILSAMALI